MNREGKIDILMSKYSYNQPTAIAVVDSKGICAYCQTNLIDSPSAFWSAQIDHLLPKSKYPSLDLEASNCVYSCYRCNVLKASFDPLEDFRTQGIDVSNPISLLQEKREDIIFAVRKYLQPYLRRDDNDYKYISNLVRQAK